MKTLNTLIALSVALLITAAIGSAHAEDGEMMQTLTHDRIQTHIKLQATNADFAQSLKQEQNMVMNKNQNQYQYQYKQMNKASAERGNSGEGSAAFGSMSHDNTMNRYSQSNSISESMNRQNTATRSMGGGRH